MALSNETTALAHLLIDGATKVFANAEALYSEATILANAEAWPRALFLHQISLEECAKIEMLVAAVTSLFLGHELDLKRLGRAFSQHSSKNKTNAYFLPRNSLEKEAEEKGDLGAARREFQLLQESFHKESNTDKNGALYVDFTQIFFSPLETINEERLVKVRSRNDEFMSMAWHKVEMLKRWKIDLAAAANDVATLQDALNLDQVKRGDAEAFKAFRSTLEQRIRELAQKRRPGN